VLFRSDSNYKCCGHGEQTEAPYPENRISDVTAHLDTRKPDGQPECRGERADECADDIADHDRVGGSNLIDTVHRNDLLHDRQQCKVVRIRIQDQFERCPEYTDNVMKIWYQDTAQYHHDVLCERIKHTAVLEYAEERTGRQYNCRHHQCTWCMRPYPFHL